MFEYEVFLNSWLEYDESLDENILFLLEFTQWIRVIKYIPDPKLKQEYVLKTKELIQELQETFKGNINVGRNV